MKALLISIREVNFRNWNWKMNFAAFLRSQVEKRERRS
jgi:hypothetical protein